MPGIRNVHKVEPTDEASINGAVWPLIELFLLLFILIALMGAILVLSLWCTSSNAIRQQQEDQGEEGKTGSKQQRQRQQHHLRHGLHVTILLIGTALSIVSHFSCNILRLEESPSDEIHAIGIWKVWHEEYNVCLDVAVIDGFAYPTPSGRDTRTLAVLATLFGAASLLFLLFGSTQSGQPPPGTGRVKATRMSLLSLVCGFGAAALQGGALATLHHSDACDDYHCRRRFAAGAMWPMLAIMYWIAGLVVTLLFTVPRVQQQQQQVVA